MQVPFRAMGLLDPAARSGIFDLGLRVSQLKRKSAEKVYHGHQLAWYGIIPVEKFKKLYPARPESMYSLMAAESLGLISF